MDLSADCFSGFAGQFHSELLDGEHIEFFNEFDILLRQDQFLLQAFVLDERLRRENAFDRDRQQRVARHAREHAQHLGAAVEGVEGRKRYALAVVALALKEEI